MTLSGPTAALARLLIFLFGLLVFLGLELAAPYRPSTVAKSRRWRINLSLAAFNAALITLAFAGAIAAMAAYVAADRLGVLNRLDLPGWARLLAAVVVLDVVQYVWHLLNHQVPVLWRFHRVHHSDLNMDVSTASRFHAGELALSALIRIGLVFFLGLDLMALAVYESLANLSAQFHHSSLRVPAAVERLWWLLFVPPSMHRIHHSVVIRERDTNYGVIFSLWNRLLGTLVSRVDQGGIRIGIGAYARPERLGFFHLLVMPFTRAVR